MFFVSPMDNNDWDLFAIVRSCKASTPTPHDTISENPSLPSTITNTNTTTTTNNTISHQRATPSYFDNCTSVHQNSSISFATPTIPIPTSLIPTIITNTTTSPTTTIPSLSTTIIPTTITTTTPTTFTTTALTSIIRTLTTTIVTPATTTIPTIITNTHPNTFIPIPTTIINTVNITSPTNNSTTITPIYTTTTFTASNLTTTPATTIIPTITTNTASSPTAIIHAFSTATIPQKITSTTNTITNTNTSIHNSNRSSTFFNIPTFIEQQLMQPNQLTELEKLKLNFNPNTTISIPTNTFGTFNITNPNTTNTTIAPIYTTNTFTRPTLTSTICTHTTTTTHPTMNNTNISVQGTNQYPTISNFTIPIKQQIQPNNNNQVFFPKHGTHIEMKTLHFDRTYNQPPVSQQLPRESNQLPLVPQINSQVLSSTHPQEPQHNSRKRKNNNQMGLEGHVIEEVKEDSWTWIKYGQKPIRGSPHPRSYYKCNSFGDCPARKMVQKSKTKDNAYVVTYKSDHNHKKPAGNLNSMIGTSRNKSSETRLPATREPGSSLNAGNFHLPNVAVLQFDQPESSNVSNLGSPNVMMLQFDQLESNNGQIFAYESDKKFTGSLDDDDDDDDILLEKMKTMLENFLVDFKHLRALIPLD